MISLLLISALAAAGQDAPQAREGFDPDQKVCRRYAVTGSRVKSRSECRTREEWAKVDEQNRTETQRALEGQRLRAINPAI